MRPVHFERLLRLALARFLGHRQHSLDYRFLRAVDIPQRRDEPIVRRADRWLASFYEMFFWII